MLFQLVMLTAEATDMFDIQQFGNASEADILTLIVKEKKEILFLMSFIGI